ncbi:3-dehydroquinate synthase [Sinimarinibacterium sp. NLF-5-8]|uniref:3-dehydroquinate synthase n=1 Tax=Sinimarinibacterium sp. NLF-5-8 TaxID=2698684 RepID=UPI00137C2FD1|nr:3-dehydroquinate synthase [Sinimarinibacterium sp. NLF-5-8]QHS10785.1 3-dehydroquinate synthase [Sinimarinibacterium sp. NLF-5-8]
MPILHVDLAERGYPIHIGANVLTDAALWAPFAGRPLRLITDDNVARHHLAPLKALLQLSDEAVRVIPHGEPQKSWAVAGSLQDWLLQTRLPRDGVLVALGGGVVGDLVGFTAAIYQRGVDFVQVPTTLLSQVDSSVGGKTGINHPLGKNMIGAFHQPRLVLADTDALRTLPQRELLAGIAEVIKYGLLGDERFLSWIEAHLDALLALDQAAIGEAVRRSCEMKAQIVARDEKESGERALLNLGHTFGHAIETWAGYGHWLHGEAVAAGMCMAADLSARLGWIGEADAARATALIARAGLPVGVPQGMQPADFMQLMALDKKVASGKVRLILLRALGQAVMTADFAPAALQQTLHHFCQQTP